jgi:hypothetical protein
MKHKKRLALLIVLLALLIPAATAIAAYSKTFTLKAEITLSLPDATAEPTSSPTPEPTPTPDPGKQVKIVYHSSYDNNSVTRYAPRKSTITLEGELFQRDWYKLIGWSSRPYGRFAEFNLGDTYRTGSNTEHFYAVWEFDWNWFDPWPWGRYGSGMEYGGGSDPAAPEEETPAPATETPSPEAQTPSPAEATPSPGTDGADTPSPSPPNEPTPALEGG